MKTPTEKAKELIERFVKLFPHPTEDYLDVEEAILCALILVDEIQNYERELSMFYHEIFNENSNFWQEVKDELTQMQV